MAIKSCEFLIEIPEAVIYKKHEYKAIPNTSGVYVFYNEDREVLYVGKSKELVRRVSSHILGTTHTSFSTEIVTVDIYLTDTEYMCSLLELVLINEMSPIHNKRDIDADLTRNNLSKSEFWAIPGKFVIYTENTETIRNIKRRMENHSDRIKASAKFYRDGKVVAEQFIFERSLYRSIKTILRKEQETLERLESVA